MTGGRQFCTFYLRDDLFGIESRRVREVFGARPVTPVPRAPRGVRGLVNLRGQILLVVDVRERLALPPRAAEAGVMNLVVELKDGPVSLLVDRIDDVLDVPAAGFEAPPSTFGARDRELIVGAYKLAGRLLHVLDVDRLVAPAAEG
ncbi:MAG TPA: chemotaxis protein CheW [Polyangia bacterium]|nr:chemotaxis protein CheW [Polyangia bacterium]